MRYMYNYLEEEMSEYMYNIIRVFGICTLVIIMNIKCHRSGVVHRLAIVMKQIDSIISRDNTPLVYG